MQLTNSGQSQETRRILRPHPTARHDRNAACTAACQLRQRLHTLLRMPGAAGCQDAGETDFHRKFKRGVHIGDHIDGPVKG